MTTYETGRYEMFKRIVKFRDAHVQLFPERSDAHRAFAVVAKAVAQIDDHTSRKRNAKLHGWRQQRLAREALRTNVDALAKAAADEARRVPGADARFPPPKGRSDMSLILCGRLFVDECERARPMFLRLGFADSFAADLSERLEAFEATRKRSRDKRTTVAIAREATQRAFEEGFAGARTLDLIVANTVGRESPILALWKDIRRNDSRRKTRVTTNSAAEQATSTAAASATIDEAAPAARRAPSLLARVGVLSMFALLLMTTPLLAQPAPPPNDYTLFTGAISVPGTRPAVGVALGHVYGVAGFEIEYFSTRPHDFNEASAGGIFANVIVHPVTQGYLQYYGLFGLGLYGQHRDDGRSSDGDGLTKDLGVGAKIWISEHLRARVDYRLFFPNRSEYTRVLPEPQFPQRIAVGLNLHF